MAAWTSATRQVANMTTRLCSPKFASNARAASSLFQRRGLAGAAEHHGTPKVNFWEDPMSPSKWKQGHLVIVPLVGCGLGYGGYTYYTGDKDKKEEVRVREVPR